MTLYLFHAEKRAGKRTDAYRPLKGIFTLCAKPEGGEPLTRFAHDATPESRQRMLRFIEQWAREHNITIGNAEAWSLPKQKESA